MSKVQSAKAMLRHMPDSPLKWYVDYLERQVANRPKKTDRIMKLKKEIIVLRNEVEELNEFLLKDGEIFAQIQGMLPTFKAKTAAPNDNHAAV